MLTKDKFIKIMVLSLPIIGGAISQNLLNLVDTAMVGRLGHIAVAASGLGSFANFMSQAIILGLSPGVQAIAARRVGEGLKNDAGKPLTSGLLLAVLIGPILSAIVYALIPYIVPYLNSDPEVISLAIPYWRIRVVAIAFVGMNFSFRGFFNGIKMPRIYMMTLVVMHLANIILNYGLIFGNFGLPEMGVSGAALASSISIGLGTLTYFLLSFIYAAEFGFFKSLPTTLELKNLLKISIPSGIQQLFFAAGFTMLFIIIGSIGTKELAAANILINIVLVCILPGFGFGLAAATLIGTSIGEKDFKQAKIWPYEVSILAGTSTFFMGLVIAFFARSIISIFIDDPLTIEIAVKPLVVSGLFICTDIIGIIFMNALLGSGDSKTVLKWSIFYQWILFLPISYLGVHYAHFSLLFVWTLFCSYRLGLAIHFWLVWRQEKWKTIAL